MAVFICNSDSDPAPGGRLPRPAAAATGAGRPDHAGRPGHLGARRAPAPGIPVVLVDRGGWQRLVQCRRRRRRGRRRSPSPTCCEQGHQRIAFVGGPMTHRAGRRPPRGRAGRDRGRPDARRRARGVRDGGPQRRRGPASRRAARRPAPGPAADGGVLRQRPARARPAAADDPHGRRRAPSSWPSSATTTSSSPAPRPSRSARSASHASCSAVRPPSCCWPRATSDDAHVHQQVLFHPELVVRTSSAQR